MRFWIRYACDPNRYSYDISLTCTSDFDTDILRSRIVAGFREEKMGDKAEVLEAVLKEAVDLVPDPNLFRYSYALLGFRFYERFGVLDCRKTSR